MAEEWTCPWCGEGAIQCGHEGHWANQALKEKELMRIVLYAIYSDAKRQGYQNWQVTPDVQEAILRIFEPEVYKNG